MFLEGEGKLLGQKEHGSLLVIEDDDFRGAGECIDGPFYAPGDADVLVGLIEQAEVKQFETILIP